MLHYRKIGDGNPIFILHGLFGSADNWQTFAKALLDFEGRNSTETHGIYMVDQRNHGRSFHSRNHSYQDMSDDLLEVIEYEKLKKVSIIGHSMGGKTAMQFALDNPELVNSLVVVDIGPKYYAPHHHSEIEGMSSLDLAEMKNRKEADDHMAKFIEIPAARQFLLKNIYRDAENKFQWRMNLPVLIDEISEVGSEIRSHSAFRGNVLFVSGENSGYILAEDKEYITALFPDAIIVTAPDSGHWVQVDQPDWLVEQVARFLISSSE